MKIKFFCLDAVQYYDSNSLLPLYPKHGAVNLKEIFEICFQKNVSQENMCKERPMRIKKTANFVVNQQKLSIKHPYDLEADDTPGSFAVKDQVRFYQIVRDENGDFMRSVQVHVNKDLTGKIISGRYKEREGVRNQWVDVVADIKDCYAVVRRRGVHKKTKAEKNVSFVRLVIFIMTLDEYNLSYKKLKDLTTYSLAYNYIILQYYFDSEEEIALVPERHGNSIHKDSYFRPTAHSTRKETKELAKSSNKAPRLIIDETTENILTTTTNSTTPRDAKQISNFRYNNKDSSDVDAFSLLIYRLLEQSKMADCVAIDDNQPFLREILLADKVHPKFVLYLDQTICDIERFCSMKAIGTNYFSVLGFDTTFNIAEHYLTQTVYHNKSLISRKYKKHPLFPGPLLIHRSMKVTDFSFFWQSVCRKNKNLTQIASFGTDECFELMVGIALETSNESINLLGIEHVKRTVEKQLEKLNFPQKQKKEVLFDIFGGDNKTSKCLVECETSEEFDDMVDAFKDKWTDLELRFTRNKPADKFVKYFVKCKENAIKNKISKICLQKIGLTEFWGQNPIEWLNFLSKDEINQVDNKSGHRFSKVNEVVAILKNRNIRAYKHAVEALYDEGPYMISEGWKKFKVTYDDFMEMSEASRKEMFQIFQVYSSSAIYACGKNF